MNTKREIINSGIAMFKKYGYDNTSISMICKEAKISKGTFYYHFQNKSEIMYGYIETFMSEIISVIPDILQLNSPKDQLWELYKYSFEHIVSLNANLLFALYKADMEDHLKLLSPSSKWTYQYHTNSLYKMILGLVKKCQEKGEIRENCSAEVLILAFNSAVIGIGLDWCCQGGKYDEVEQLKLIFEAVFSK